MSFVKWIKKRDIPEIGRDVGHLTKHCIKEGMKAKLFEENIADENHHPAGV
jgi:hypothetical protein